MKILKSAKEFQDTIYDEKYVLVDWFATWCGPCKMVAPYFEAIEDEYEDVIFAKMDVNNAFELSQSYGVKKLPTFQLFKNGKLKDQVLGSSIEDVIKMLSKR